MKIASRGWKSKYRRRETALRIVEDAILLHGKRAHSQDPFVVHDSTSSLAGLVRQRVALLQRLGR